MIDKTVGSAAQAVADIPEGATVMVGGFGQAGIPHALIDALIDHGVRDLTIVSNNAGNGDTGVAALIREKRVRRIVCSFPRQSDSWHFDAAWRAGEIELELVPQGNLAERIRAAGAGIGAFYTRTGVGTDLAAGKETRMIDGYEHVLEHPIHADFALIRAQRGDRWGNLVYRKTARNFGPVMATAARCTIAQVSEIVPLGALDPETIVTPGVFVRRVVAVSGRAGAHGMNEPLPRWTHDEMARRVALDIPAGAVVNLGIGMPTRVANHLPAGREVILHSENGVLGMGPAPAPGEEDPDLINAGKQPVTLRPGAAFFHSADSFAMMRGGHLDVCVLGAFQVSVRGDLANWHTGAPGAVPAVGGAMDLALGAKQVFVLMEHLTKEGASKLVEHCSYPLTARRCVARIYTDLAVLDVVPAGFTVRAIVPGLDRARLERVSGVPLLLPTP